MRRVCSVSLLVLVLALLVPDAAFAQNGGLSFWDGWLEKMSGPKFRGREFYLPIGCLQSDTTALDVGGENQPQFVSRDRLVQPWNRYNFDDRLNAAAQLQNNFVSYFDKDVEVGKRQPRDEESRDAVRKLPIDVSVRVNEPPKFRTCFSLHAHFARAIDRDEVDTAVYSRSVELRASWALPATLEAVEAGTGAGIYEIGDQARFSRHPYVSVFAAAKPGRLLPDGSWAERIASIVRFEGGGRLFVTRLQSEDISVLLPGGEFTDHTFYRPTGYVGVSLDLTELIWPWRKYSDAVYTRKIQPRAP